MAKLLEIDTNKYAIIPSVGASNCVNVCIILHGWGCRYIALFDYDKAGVEKGGEHMRKELYFEYKKQYCYVKEVSEEDISSQTYKSPYMIEDVMTKAEIERFCVEKGYTNVSKALTAKLMCTAIESGAFDISQESKNNFKDLFTRIFSYCA